MTADGSRQDIMPPLQQVGRWVTGSIADGLDANKLSHCHGHCRLKLDPLAAHYGFRTAITRYSMHKESLRHLTCGDVLANVLR